MGSLLLAGGEFPSNVLLVLLKGRLFTVHCVNIQAQKGTGIVYPAPVS